jgi:hypothetical protein
MRKGTPSPIFIKAIDKFGELWTQRHKESGDSAQLQPGPMDKCLDFTMCSITKKASRERIVAACTATLKSERLKIFKDGSLKDEGVGYAIATIAMDFLSIMMAVEGARWTKNQKTRQIREL